MGPSACFQHVPGWLPDHLSVLTELSAVLGWEQRTITMFGRTVPTPRLTAWVGDAPYTYSGVRNDPQTWPARLAGIRDLASVAAGVEFNSCLVNLYRDGGDSMGYHSDDEPELGAKGRPGSPG